MSLQLFTKETELALYELISANSLNDEQSKAVTDFVFGRLEAFGASQAQQTTAELPEAAKCECGWGELCVYYYTAEQMHAHYQAGVSAGRGMEWRTIDSAPKDGRSFDVWVKSTKNPDYGVRMTGVYYVQGVLCGSRFPNSSWCEYASHWMPLPAVPKEQKQ